MYSYEHQVLQITQTHLCACCERQVLLEFLQVGSCVYERAQHDRLNPPKCCIAEWPSSFQLLLEVAFLSVHWKCQAYGQQKEKKNKAV